MTPDRIYRIPAALSWSEVYLLADERIVRWKSNYIVRQFEKQADGSHVAKYPGRSFYRGLCIKNGEPHAIFEPA